MAERWCWFRGKVRTWITLLLLYFLSFPGFVILTFSEDLRNEFLAYDIIKPVVSPSVSRASREKRETLNKSKYPEHQVINYRAFGTEYILDLHVNRNLIPKNYFEKYHSNGNSVLENPYSKTSEHCYYQGQVRDKPNSWAAVSLCSGISGMIFDGDETHYIEPDGSTPEHLVFKAKDKKNVEELRCGYTGSSINNDSILHKLYRPKRSNFVHDPYLSNSKSRFVELVIVNDNQEFRARNSSREAVFHRSKQIANIVNSLYAPMNIFIALVGVVIWSEYDEIKLSTDGDATLTNFLYYRRHRLAYEHHNDNAQLITAIKFDGGVVGKALKGPICTWEFSGGVNMDHSKVVSLVATTVAHELGHNFGMEHDSDECKCPDEKCIMSPSSGNTSPKHWSHCSSEYLSHAFDQGMDYCLQNKPKEVIGPVCGNGFLEPEEECDCGYVEFCDNKCCNASTCKLFPNASCATGSCCDPTTCQPKKIASVCREAKSSCDLPEFCNGQSEFCPGDVYVQDGVECNHGEAYCFEGNCQSHDDQCKLLWGISGNVSEVKCFEQNQNGNDNGNCGYYKPNKTHKACAKEDALCGRLHCVHHNEKLEFGMESAATLAHSFIQHKGKTVICRSATVDLGLADLDPGLAPNGAKCGDGKACFHQYCRPVSEMKPPACPFGCNFNGVCNNKQNCHCIVGFSPPMCDTPGPGGSLDSGPASDPTAGYHFLVAMYVIFLCIVPLTAIAAFGIYYFRRHLKTWWIAKARKAAIKSRAKQATQRKPRPPSGALADLRNVEISSPLPAKNSMPSAPPLSADSSGLSTLNRFSFRTLEISPPIPQSTTNENVGKLLPVRPAPPRPLPKRTPSWAPGGSQLGAFATVTRSSSVRATGENGRPLSAATRPHCPPPPRPPPPKAISPPSTIADKPIKEEERSETPNLLINGGGLDFSDTPLAFVHTKNNINSGTVATSQPPVVSFSRPPNTGGGLNNSFNNRGPTYGNIGWVNVAPIPNQNNSGKVPNRVNTMNNKLPLYANTNHLQDNAPLPPPANMKPSLVVAPSRGGAAPPVAAFNNANTEMGQSSIVASLAQRFEQAPDSEKVSSFRPIGTTRPFQK